MINILYCIPGLYNPGGMERILTEKINYLIETGCYSITIMTTEQMDRPFYFRLNKDVKIINLDLGFDNFFSDHLFAKYYKTKKLLKKYKILLEDFIKTENIDICISLGGKELEFLSDIDSNCKKIVEIHFAKSIRKQFITARHDNFFWRFLGDFRTRILVNQTKKLDRIVVLTKADELEWKTTNNNVIQIYNFSPIVPVNKPKLVNKKIVAVGKLDPQKGFDLLIESCSYISNWDGWTLSIYGQGSEHKNLNNQIKKYNLDDKVFLEGISKNVYDVYSTASIYVLSSRYEGFPMVLLEAISFGLPLVAFDCITGPNEIIKNNDCGILVENGNVKSLAESIKWMMENREERERMSEKSFEKSNFFSKEQIMNQWELLFKELVEIKN